MSLSDCCENQLTKIKLIQPKSKSTKIKNIWPIQLKANYSKGGKT